MRKSFVSFAGFVCLVAIAMPAISTAAKPVTPKPATPNSSRQRVDREPLKPTVQSVEKRFAKSGSTETPDFQKHVIPLMGRLGCNGRSCHGSFQGAGGFQLSLFGYDFTGDHKALLDEQAGRVDVDDVAESLILAKPIDADMHDGGKRMDKDSWQYNVLHAWIKSGAATPSAKPQKLKRLAIYPSEILVRKPGAEIELKAVAHWQDGTIEDVTELCRFSSNDDAIADISDKGVVKSGAKGDTHVVVYYDNAVVPVPVLHPLTPQFGDAYVSTNPEHPVDALIEQKLAKLGITPSAVCDDADFVRRVHLHITGTIPTAAIVKTFLADQTPSKRERLIESLLETPEYAAWWATRFSDWTGNSEAQMNNLMPIRGAGSRLWYEWLRQRLADNVPYDKIVEGIVTADNRQPGESYEEFCASMTAACQPGGEAEFTKRDGLPQFWARNNFRAPEERAIGFAYTFLGVRIQCAQCHKHPFDQWSKNDFDEFAKLFTTVQARNNTIDPESRKEREQMVAAFKLDPELRGNQLRNELGKLARKGEVVPFPELIVAKARESKTQLARRKKLQKKLGRRVDPKVPTGLILGQDEVVKLDSDPRERLMDWLRSPENPYFAKAIVNRVWANYFGIGIVDPTDDMNLANPPSNAALLDHLADGLMKNDFDLRWLHRTITTSDAYQRSWEMNDSNAADKTNFSHHIPHRHPAEVLYDAVLLATAGDEKADQVRGEFDGRATSLASPAYRNNNRDGSGFALSVFGQSIRETQCDCDRTEDSSLLQTIYLRNDSDIHRLLTERSGWVAQQCQEIGVAMPSARGSLQAAAAKKRADLLLSQLRKRAKTYREMSQAQKERYLPKLAREIDRATERLFQYGMTMPEYLAKFGTQDVAEAKQKPELDWTPVVQDAYLRSLSRYPESDEIEAAVAFIGASETPAEGIEGLLWTLVNTKEFILSH